MGCVLLRPVLASVMRYEQATDGIRVWVQPRYSLANSDPEDGTVLVLARGEPPGRALHRAALRKVATASPRGLRPARRGGCYFARRGIRSECVFFAGLTPRVSINHSFPFLREALCCAAISTNNILTVSGIESYTKRPDTSKLLGGNPSSCHSYEKPLALDKIQVSLQDGFPLMMRMCRRKWIRASIFCNP